MSAASGPNVRIILNWESGTRFRYEELIRERFPGLPIRTYATADEARPEIGDAEVVMAFGGHLPRGIFEDARRLRWVHSFGTGVDGIVDQPFLSNEVLVTATRGIHGPPMSELALLLMLSLAREFPRSVRAQERREWDRWRVRLLHRKTVGILGVGLIAEDLAPRCKAFGMEVVGISRVTRPLPGFDRMLPREDLVRIAGELDFLVLLIPYSPATHHVVGEEVLGAMKPTSYLVNIARGGVLDEEALLRALDRRTIAGAALDVMQQEPLPSASPLWSVPNLIITPHLGGYYDVYVDDSVDQICENLERFLDGRSNDMENRVERP